MRGNRHRRLAATAIALLVGLLASVIMSPPGQAQPATTGATSAVRTTTATATAKSDGKIQPALRRQLDKGHRDFWVTFTAQADLAPAARTHGWKARGQAVTAALRSTSRASQAAALERLRTAHARFTTLWIDNTIYVHRGSAALARQLAADPRVATIRPTRTYELPTPVKGKQPTRKTAQAGSPEWGITAIHADQVWDEYGSTGAGIVVGSIDSGAEFDHPALVHSYRGRNADGSFSHDHNWYDPAHVCGEAKPCDNAGHGTHTMGTMVGDDGGDNHVGVAPGARWIAAKGCESDLCSDLSLALAAQWMLAPTALDGSDPDPALRPQILNNSWSSAPGDEWYRDYVKQWVAAGIFPAFAVGNRGPACGTEGTPGEYPEAYAVGAVDQAGNVAPFSSRGSADGAPGKPDIAAPGVNVRSSWTGGTYRVLGGTSMATPHVSGTVALMWSAAPALVGDVAATRDILDRTAQDRVDTSCGGTAGDNNVYGQGILDAYAAISASPRRDAGTVTGTVTDAGDGSPLAGVTVRATGGRQPHETTTGADGRYTLYLDQGRYDLEVSLFGYNTRSFGAVDVTKGEVVTQNAVLTATPRAKVAVTVRDDSGHGWPLYAEIEVDGRSPSVFTDPGTGRVALDLPVGHTYKLAVTPAYGGYLPVERDVKVTAITRGMSVEVAADVDPQACTAPGYAKQGTDCTQVPGGLVYGGVTDANTHRALDGAVVTTGTAPVVRATTEPTPEDPGRPDGFYWLFSPQLGARAFTASAHNYQTNRTTRIVPRNSVIRSDFDLRAGKLVVSTGKVSGRTVLGGKVTRQVTLTNEGTAPATYAFAESQQGFTIQASSSESAARSAHGSRTTGAPIVSQDDGARVPVRRTAVKGLTPGRDTSASAAAPPSGKHSAPRTAGGPWHPIADYPTSIKDNAAAIHDGKVYSFGGTVAGYGATRASYVYDPATGRWSPLATMPEGRQKPASGFVDGKFYVVGGWGPDGPPAATTLVYDPATDRWTTRAANPHPWGAVGSAVLDGRIYSVGGCTGDCQTATDQVTAYDVAGNRFVSVAPYPEPISWPSCGGIDGRVYCTGGLAEGPDSTRRSYAYDPETDRWSRVADAPLDLWASSYAVANGRLVVAGGAAKDSTVLTNEAFAYDPGADTWTALPNSVNGLFRGAAACGFYKVGGANGPRVMAVNEVLTGYDDCEEAGTDAPWLTEQPAAGTVAPGAEVTVALALDSRHTSQPGTYQARLLTRADTPYDTGTVDVEFVVDAPSSWVRLSGQVSGATCDGAPAPLPGAVVAVDRGRDAWTLTTDAIGEYVLWVPGSGQPSQVIVAADGYRPTAFDVRLRGADVRRDVTLPNLRC